MLHLWGLLLASGIIELVIGVWAIGYPGRSAWLLILWVGIGAVIRGVTEIVLAFKLRAPAPDGLDDQGPPMTKTRTLILALAVVAIVLTAGAARSTRPNETARRLGEAVCDLRDATTPEDAQSALDDLNNQLNDLGNKYAVFTAEDRADVQNNLADLPSTSSRATRCS